MEWKDLIAIVGMSLWIIAFVVASKLHRLQVKKLRLEIARLTEANRAAKIERLLEGNKQEKSDTKDDSVISGYMGKY